MAVNSFIFRIKKNNSFFNKTIRETIICFIWKCVSTIEKKRIKDFFTKYKIPQRPYESFFFKGFAEYYSIHVSLLFFESIVVMIWFLAIQLDGNMKWVMTKFMVRIPNFVESYRVLKKYAYKSTSQRWASNIWIIQRCYVKPHSGEPSWWLQLPFEHPSVCLSNHTRFAFKRKFLLNATERIALHVYNRLSNFQVSFVYIVLVVIIII